MQAIWPATRLAPMRDAHGGGEGSALSARDAVHVAVMRRRGVDRILSFDRGFDGLDGIVRIA